MKLYEPTLEPLTSERKGRPMLSPGVFVRVASIPFDPPSLYSLHRRTFLKGSFFGSLLLSWHYAPFHEEWGFSLDKLNGWWVQEGKFVKLQTAFGCLRARTY